ncbi:hypothetical protein EJA72_11165 [Pseudomonas sp. PB120]|nr:hypothetical protein [Pseudomonas sp. PB120]
MKRLKLLNFLIVWNMVETLMQRFI